MTRCPTRNRASPFRALVCTVFALCAWSVTRSSDVAARDTSLVTVGAAENRSVGAAPAEQADAPRLRVATKAVEPFLRVVGDRPSGFSIDLWEKVATSAGLSFEWIVVDSVGAQLDAATSRRDRSTEAINAALLAICEDGTYTELCEGWGLAADN